MNKVDLSDSRWRAVLKKLQENKKNRKRGGGPRF